jgi:hypothetical protein
LKRLGRIKKVHWKKEILDEKSKNNLPKNGEGIIGKIREFEKIRKCET